MSLARDMEPLRAECGYCRDWYYSDPLTFEEALAAGWAVVESKLACTDHLTICARCGDPCLLEQDGCVADGIWHCSECARDCSDCGRWEAAERSADA
jgi:hypothetical protein